MLAFNGCFDKTETTLTSWRASVRASVGTFLLDAAIEGSRQPVALIGPNGSGKTTFLRFLVGAVHPEEGEFILGNKSLVDTQKDVNVPTEQRRVGYVPQGYGLFSHLNVLDNVGYGLVGGPNRLDLSQRHLKARQILENLGCASLAGRRVAGLSGGEQQWIALARALVIEPELLLLDEPLSALDASKRRKTRKLLSQRLQLFGRPSILTTHDVRDVAVLGAHIYVLEKGRIIQSGTLDHLIRKPASDFVAEFVGPATLEDYT